VTQFYYIVILGAIFVYPSGYAGYIMPVLLAMILAEVATRRFRRVPTTLDRPLVFLLATVVLSGLGSAWRAESLGIGMLFALMVPVSIYPAARILRERAAVTGPIVGAWVAGGIVAAAWGILRAPATWPSGASTPALLGTGFGTTMAATISLALGAWTVCETRSLRIGLAGGLPILVTALSLTTSRAAWMAAAAGAVAMIALAPRRRTGLIILCAMSFVFAAAATTAEHRWLEHRMESISSLEANADRIAMWRGALRMVRDHPLTGVGYGTFVRAWPAYHTEPGLEGKPTAHNVFLNFAAETGLLGATAFLAVVGAGMAALWNRLNAHRRDPHVDGLWTGFFGAALAVMIQQLFDATIISWHVGYGLLVIFALAAVKTAHDP
jgi:O-antigen ligase